MPKTAETAVSTPPGAEEETDGSFGDAQENRDSFEDQAREAARADGKLILPRTWFGEPLHEVLADADDAGFEGVKTHDVKGQDRDRSNPRESKVCVTTPQPDEHPIGTELTLGVAKMGELCV